MIRNVGISGREYPGLATSPIMKGHSASRLYASLASMNAFCGMAAGRLRTRILYTANNEAANSIHKSPTVNDRAARQ